MNRLVWNTLIGMVAFLISQTPLAYSLPTFPGAEGFGSDTPGGRGGDIVKVTNLNDNGPGSFREAVTVPGRHYANGSYQYEPFEQFQARIEASGPRIGLNIEALKFRPPTGSWAKRLY